MILTPKYRTEQDVDTYIHTSFRRSQDFIYKKYNIRCNEMFFNPPGGNWSKIELSSHKNIINVWDHVKREDQRPDIIWSIEYNNSIFIIVMESKEKYSDQNNVSHQFLFGYGKELLETPSTNNGYVIKNNYKSCIIYTGYICSHKEGVQSTNKFDIELHIDWGENKLNKFFKPEIDPNVKNVFNLIFNN